MHTAFEVHSFSRNNSAFYDFIASVIKAPQAVVAGAESVFDGGIAVNQRQSALAFHAY